jgi:hypothetical protein
MLESTWSLVTRFHANAICADSLATWSGNIGFDSSNPALGRREPTEAVDAKRLPRVRQEAVFVYQLVESLAGRRCASLVPCPLRTGEASAVASNAKLFFASPRPSRPSKRLIWAHFTAFFD